MNRIKRVSLLFRVIFQIMFITAPLLLIYAWINSPESLVMMGGAINMSFIPRAYTSMGSHGSSILHVLSYSERWMGFCMSAIPLLIELYILHALIKLFKLYEKGEIFSINNVLYIRNIGYALLLGQIVNPFYEALMGLILTWHNPPGHRLVAITLDQTNVGILFTALLVILISWIMAEVCKLREEQQLTI